MKPPDTSMGGDARRFPATTWGMVARLRDPGGDDRRAAFEALGRRYWKPVYRYARIAWARSNDDAKDLVQAFFLWLLERDTLARFSPDRGSFRNFLTVLLDRFGNDLEKHRTALKRGGGARAFTLEEARAADEEPSGPAETDPKRAFERAWLEETIRAAVDRVRTRFGSDFDARRFQVFQEFALADPEARPSYADLAGKLGMKESDVRNHLSAVRQALREELRAELSDQAPDDSTVQDEWNALFGS